MAREERTRERSNDSLIDRRHYLKIAGVAATSTAAVGAGKQAIAATASETVNVVDAGADPNGNQAIDSVLSNVVGDDVEVYFPSGTYKVNSFSTSANNVTFRGDDATLFPSGSPGSMLKFSGNNWTFDGFTLDATQRPSATPKSWLVTTGQGWTVKNVTAKGKLTGGKRYFLPYVPNGDGKGVFKNITATDGSQHDTAGCYYVHEPHEGTLVLDDVDIRNFGSRGIYHSGASPGTTVIKNSYWENNRVNVRFAGRNCKLKNTTIKQTVSKRGPDYCVWLRANSKRPQGNVHAEAYGAVIEDCDLVVDGTESSSPPDQASAISVGGGSNGYFGSFDVRNTRIRIEGANATAGIHANGHTQPQGIGGNVPETRARVENVQITTGGNVDGVCLQNRDGSTVKGSCIDAAGQALDFQNASVSTANISKGSCTLPSLDGYTDGVVSDGSDGSGSDSDGSSGTTDGTTDGSSDGSSDGSDGSSGDTSGDSTDDSDDTTDGSETDSGSTGGSAGGTTGGSSDDATDADLPNTLTITGGSRDDLVHYRVSVTDTVAKSTANGATTDSEDTVLTGGVDVFSGESDAFGMATGAVAGGADSYEFAGDISDFETDGDVTVTLNGSEVDPASLGATDDLPNTLVIDGTGSTETSRYTFVVDGDVEKSAELGLVSSEDTISDGRVEGAVAGGKDGFRFCGDVTQFHLEGTATVDFEDTDG